MPSLKCKFLLVVYIRLSHICLGPCFTLLFFPSFSFIPSPILSPIPLSLLSSTGPLLTPHCSHSLYQHNGYVYIYIYIYISQSQSIKHHPLSLVHRDPFHHSVLPIHLCTLVELKLKHELFFFAHQLVEAYPKEPVAWFSVGCYYYLTGKFDIARRYFNKGRTMDNYFLPCWIGFGNAFAAENEGDQAMVAYRTAARLFHGSHIPLLYIGMEYLRKKNVSLALQFLKQAAVACPDDPLSYNELGVLYYKQGMFADSVDLFQRAVKVSENSSPESQETPLINCGHALRKLGHFEQAIQHYTWALAVNSKNAATHSALGFAYHLKNDFMMAVEHYHKSLGLRSGDTFTEDALARAMERLVDDESYLRILGD